MRRSWLCRLLITAVLVLAPRAALAQFTVQRTSSDIFYNDVGNTPSLSCMYASYRVTNTSGSPVGDVWVDIGNFTGGVVHIAPTEPGLRHIGPMATGASRTVFFYLEATSTTGTTQSHSVRVYTSRPPASPAVTQSFSFSSVQSTIKANANKVTTVVSGPTPPHVGGIVTITVTGQTGTIGAPPILAFTPASDAAWPAFSYEMLGAQVTLSGSPNAGVITDSLVFSAPSASATNYVAVYTFRAVNTTATPTFVTPIGYFASGVNVKHTDTGTFGGFDPVEPAQNFLTLAKLATPTSLSSAGNAVFTLRFTNAGGTDVDVDDIHDLLPAATAYVPGSSAFDSAPLVDPLIAGQALNWASAFTIPANTSKDLTYQAAFPSTQGTYTNSAYGHVGTIVIDSTLAVTDSLPAHASVLVSPFAADVSITNSDAPDPVLVGSPLTWTLNVLNAGPDTALATAVLDTLPAGVSFVSVNTTVGTAAQSAGVVTADLLDLAPGAGATVTIQVTPSAPASLVDRAYVSSTRPDPVPGNNEATATTLAANTLAPDVQMVKRASAAAFGVGQIGSFALSATNIGSQATAGTVTVVDTLPAGVTYLGGAGAGWSFALNGSIVTATYAAALAASDSAVATLAAQFTAAAVPGVTNRAYASSASDSDPTNDMGSVSVTVSGAPDLAMAKRHVGVFQSGQPALWVLAVTNLGNVATSGTVTVVDTLPAGATFTGGAGTGWTVNAAAGIVTATNPGPIAPTDSATFTLTATLDAAAVPAITNAAVAQTAGDVDPGNDRGVDTSPVIGQPDLQLVKRDGGAFTVGGLGTYALTVTNLGTTQTTGDITLRDSLPAGVSYVSASGAGWTVVAAPPIVTATYAGGLDVNDSLAVTLSVRALATGVPAVTNTAVAATAGETNPADNTATLTTAVSGAPDLALAKSHAGTFTVGQPGQYALVARNVGNLATAATITVVDTLPTGLTFTGGSGTGWTVNEALGIVTATNPGPIAAGDSAAFTVDVSVAGPAVPAVTNTAVAQLAGDLNPANDRATDPTSVVAPPPAPDLQLVKRHSGSFPAFQTGTYALTVTNVGGGPTTGTITLTDALPLGLTYAAGAGAGWAVQSTSPTVVATYAATLAAGDSATFQLTVNVLGAAFPATTNVASVQTPGDLDAANDNASDPTTVTGAPDLALLKSHSGNFTLGQNGTYDLRVRNAGTAATTGAIAVTDSLPPGLAFVSGSGAGWSFVNAGSVVTATNPGPIAAGDSLVFQVQVGVTAPALGGVTNVAVASTPADSDPSNDRSADFTNVNGVPDLALAKRHAGPFTVGQTAVYDLAIRNVGTAASSGAITVRDTLPAGLGFAGAPPVVGLGVTALGNVVTATTSQAIAVGDSLPFALVVNVGIAAFPAVQNAAVVTNAGDTNPSNNRAVDTPATVQYQSQLVLAKEAEPARVEPADVVSYTLTIANQGVSPTPGVTVRDTLPVGFRYAAGTAFVDGTPIADPTGGVGPALEFTVGTVPASGRVTLRYRALVGTAAVLGDGTNRALALNAGLGLSSNRAAAKVDVTGGVFADDGVLMGKVFADCGCDSGRTQGHEELGVPGVRVYLEDGRSAVTDVEGKYHFDLVAPRLHTVKVDRTTLPVGARFETVDTQDGLSPGSRFADIQDGELSRADFALAGCDPAFRAELLARRELGEVSAALPTGVATIPADVTLGATRALAGTPWGGAGTAAYEHVTNDAMRDAANSLTPDAPGVPGLLAQHAVPATLGLTVSVPLAPAPADGHTLVPVTVHVPGEEPVRVTLESDAGTFQVADLDPKEDGVQTLVDKTATFALIAPRAACLGAVRVTLDTGYAEKLRATGPTALAAVREATTPIAFVPQARPWLVAGVLEGRFDGRSLHDDELVTGQVRDRFTDGYSTIAHVNSDGTTALGGRGAVFARGTLGRDVGVTFRFDSEHAQDARRFADIRPNEGDPIFGDASIQGFEAQSTERLFARLDRGRSYALYGDFYTEGVDPIRVLSAYTRGMNGGRAHLENGRVEVDGYATHDAERQVVDELAGRGVSGPYALSHADGLLNSETVELVTRDRNNPSVILARHTLTRFADYTIEPFTGRMLFKAPVPILDERLNPVSVRVSYEVQGAGDRFWAGGGSAHVKPTSHVELMGAYAKEDDPLHPHEQMGAGGTIDLGRGTSVTAEWAHTDSLSQNDARALRGEIRHASTNLDLRGYAVRTDARFANPSSGYAPGREEWGGAARYLLGDRMSASAEGVRSRDVVTGGRRKGVSLGLDRRLFEGFSIGLGYRWARESAVPALGGPPVPTPNSTDAARLHATWQFSRRTSAFTEYEKSVSGGSAKRVAVGADARVTDHVRMYGRHEFVNSFAGPYALNELQSQNSTVFGVAADGLRELSAFSEYRVRDAFDGRNAEAAFGLRDRLRVSPSVRMDWSIERVSPGKGAPSHSAITALTSGFEWTGDPLTKGSLRLEYRAANDLEQWLATAGLARKLGRDWTGLANTQWAWSPGHDQMHGVSVLALALRETDHDRWNALARLEHHLDETTPAPSLIARHEALVASTRINLRPSRPLTLMARLAGKWTVDEAGSGSITGQASLVSGRATCDLSRRIDVGVAARARMDGGFDHRSYGMGAELGATVLKNLRLFGGYNAFGFHDPDFAALERTDKGPFAGFGFKFDEGLFGHRGAESSPAVPPAAALGVARADDPFQRGALKVAPRDTLLDPGQRISDEAIAFDLRNLEAWTARARALPDSAGIYGRAKALGWLAFARDEYMENDRGPVSDAAFGNAVAIVRALSPAGGSEDSAAVRAACAAGLPGSAAPTDAQLWQRAADLRSHPGFHCAQEAAAGLDIALARAAHEAQEGEACRVPELLAEARALADSGFAAAEECVKPVAPPPIDTVAMSAVPPEAPLAEIQAALSAIPSGIHFALNHADLSLTSRVVIKDIASALAKYPGVHIELEGHTDSRGSVAYNLALSHRRVAAVRDGLVAAGVDSARITTSFVGKSGLLNTEKDTRELALNRRVEFKYYDKDGAPIATTKQTQDIQLEQPKAPAAHRPARKPASKPTAPAPAPKAGTP